MTNDTNKTLVTLAAGELVPAVELTKARQLFQNGFRVEAEKVMAAWVTTIPTEEIRGLIHGTIEAELNNGEVTYLSER
jgi:hypothetical protein